MRSTFFLSWLCLALTSVVTAQSNRFFISEYVEGSGNHKYLELYNGTGASIDLSLYRLELYANGATTATTSRALTGTLNDGEVVVYRNASATIYNGTSTSLDVVNFNGDDAIVLRRIADSAIMDVFGRVGERPNNNEWTANGFSTLNKTLVRKPTVSQGVNENPSSGFPTLSTEWIQFDTDYVGNLGFHDVSDPVAPGSSNVKADDTFTYSAQIDPLLHTVGEQSLAQGFEVFRFFVQDGGDELDDEDDLPTIISAMRFRLTHVSSIHVVGVFMGETLMGSTLDVEELFTVPLNLATVPDGTSRLFSVKVLFNAMVEDKAQVLIDLDRVTVDADGSGFIEHGPESVLESERNEAHHRIVVTATELRAFTVQEVATVHRPFQMVARATNRLGSIDLDANQMVTVSLSSGSGALTFISPESAQQTLSSGNALWSLQYGTIEAIDLTVSSASFAPVVTSIVVQEEQDESLYETIAPGLTGTALISFLREHYTVSNSLGYNTARDRMFMIIDNKKENGEGATQNTLECVYTGRLRVGYTSRSDAQGPSGSDFNTEHTWPQSLFDSQEPMMSDLHHLYPTDSGVNNARGNLPFRSISNEQVTTWYRLNTSQNTAPSPEIRGEFSKLRSGISFEPRDVHKGNVVRSMFYFWAIYSGRANVADDASFFEGMKADLLTWHRFDRADLAEIRRSDTTRYFQGNRNPFVHDSSLVARVFFPETLVSIERETHDGVKGIELMQNYPNPFNPSTTVRFSLDKAMPVRLSVYDALGREVAVLVRSTLSKGEHSVHFDAARLPSGMYMYRLSSPVGTLTRKMMLVK